MVLRSGSATGTSYEVPRHIIQQQELPLGMGGDDDDDGAGTVYSAATRASMRTAGGRAAARPRDSISFLKRQEKHLKQRALRGRSVKKGSYEWIVAKKARAEAKGKEVARHSKYTGRKRKNLR